MKLLSNIQGTVNLSTIAELFPSDPTQAFLDELTRQHSASVSTLYTQIAMIDSIHNKQVLDIDGMSHVKTLFPKHTAFLNTLPVTVSPTRTSVTELTTYLHSAITADTTELIKWIINNYSAVLPVATEEHTYAVGKLVDGLAIVHQRAAAVSTKLTQSQLSTLGILTPTTNYSVSDSPAMQVNTLTNLDARNEIRFHLAMAKQQCVAALNGTYTSIAGLYNRLGIVKDILAKLTIASIIPLWKSIV